MLEEGGFHVVENDRVVLEQFLGLLRKSAGQFLRVLRVEPHEDGFVVLLGLRIRVLFEPAIQRVTRLPVASAKIKLRLAFRNTNHADQIDLLIVVECSPEELELPVRPPADIQHPILPTAAIDLNEPRVVRLGHLGGSISDISLVRPLDFRFQAIEPNTRVHRPEFKPERQPVIAQRKLFRFDRFTGLIDQPADDRRPGIITNFKPGRRDVALNRNRSILERRLTDRNRINRQVGL